MNGGHWKWPVGKTDGRGKRPGRLQYSEHGQRGSVQVWATGSKEGYRLALAAKVDKLAAQALAPWTTVTHWLEAWLDHKLPGLDNDSTIDLYRRAIRFWTHAIGDLPVHRTAELSLAIETACNQMLADGRAGGTVLTRLTAIKQAGKWAKAMRLLAEDPAEPVRGPSRIPQRPRGAYNLTEALILDALLEPPYGAAVALGLWAGLRVGEAIAVQVGRDVDFSRHTVRVEEQLKRIVGKGQFRAAPKRQQRRTVPMSPQLEAHLRAQIAWREAYAVERGLTFPAGSDYLTLAPHLARPASPNPVRFYLAELCREAGLPYHGFHGLRHTCATLQRRAHITDMDIAAALGHKSTAELVNLYGNHPDDQRHDRMREQMRAYVAAATPVRIRQEEESA